MADKWNIPSVYESDANRLLVLAQADASLTPEGLESFALLVNGLGNPSEHVNQVKNAAVEWIQKLANANKATTSIVASIGRALALVSVP